MDSIVVLDGGKVADIGSYEEVLLRSASLVEQAEASLGVGDRSSDTESVLDGESNSKTSDLAPEADIMVQQPNFTRRSGSWSVYKYYIQSAGLTTVFFWIFFTFVGAAFASVMRKLSLLFVFPVWRWHTDLLW